MNLTKLIDDLHENKQLQKKLKSQLVESREQQLEIENQIKLVLDKDQIEYENLSEEEFQLLLSDMQSPDLINVEVVYADPMQQLIRAVQTPPGSSIQECIVLSGIMEQSGVKDLTKNKVGVYGVIKPLDSTVHDGDRIELYRPVEGKASSANESVS